jgi:hypothetical protein
MLLVFPYSSDEHLKGYPTSSLMLRQVMERFRTLLRVTVPRLTRQADNKQLCDAFPSSLVWMKAYRHPLRRIT